MKKDLLAIIIETIEAGLNSFREIMETINKEVEWGWLFKTLEYNIYYKNPLQNWRGFWSNWVIISIKL